MDKFSSFWKKMDKYFEKKMDKKKTYGGGCRRIFFHYRKDSENSTEKIVDRAFFRGHQQSKSDTLALSKWEFSRL